MAKNSPDEGKNIKMVEKQAVEASMINLKEYRAKRQFGKTPEPMADTVETPNRMPVFVVQKHVVFPPRIIFLLHLCLFFISVGNHAHHIAGNRHGGIISGKKHLLLSPIYLDNHLPVGVMPP